VYADYQARLHKAGAMDFDDLLMKTVELFRHHPEVLAYYQQRFKYVLIDEYQDTNTAQNELALALAEGHQQITIVGDGDQCLPPGTMIDTPDGAVPIETIVVGDEVLGTGGHLASDVGRVRHVQAATQRLSSRFAGGVVLKGTHITWCL
jgi:DNA helicase-2/ATP-dependent DNA helicase PcrA